MKNLANKIISFVTMFVLFTLISNGQTNVSGGIYTNTIWTVANSPYIILDTVVVFPGVTLTIEPGVTVKFNPGKQIEIRQGELIAMGTASDSITFTSNSSTPMLADYYGIYLNSQLHGEFSYCNFYYSSNGINVYSGTGNDTVKIEHSNFRLNNIGVTINTRFMNISECDFFYNNYGLDVYVLAGTIKNCRAINNQTGMDVNGGPTVRNCIIDSNSVSGLIVGSEDSIYINQIKYNGIGIRCTGHQSSGLTYVFQNEIENNQIGIQLESNGSRIYCNKICSNSLYDLNYTYTTNLNCIENNYWCTTDSLTTSAVINDGYDNASLGLLDFMPIDTTNCYITGCNIIISVYITNASCDTCADGHATANVLNAFSPFTYTWNTSPLQTTQTATGLTTGNYTVCISDANGCTACATIFVDSTNCTGFSVIAAASNSSCTACLDGNAWALISGGNPPYNYTWYASPMQYTDTAIGLAQGNYSVCVSDIYGCVACDSVTVYSGNCSAHFNIYPDTIPHHYFAVNMASGIFPLSYSWDWGDGSVQDTIPYPSHTYASAGFYTVCLSIVDSGGCTNTFCQGFYMMRNNNPMIVLNVLPALQTGISESKMKSIIAIYPNPVSEILNYVFPENLNTNIKIYNLTGEMEIEKLIKSNTGNIDVSILAEGLYILEINIDNKISRVKFMKQ